MPKARASVFRDLVLLFAFLSLRDPFARYKVKVEVRQRLVPRKFFFFTSPLCDKGWSWDAFLSTPHHHHLQPNGPKMQLVAPYKNTGCFPCGGNGQELGQTVVGAVRDAQMCHSLPVVVFLACSGDG